MSRMIIFVSLTIAVVIASCGLKKTAIGDPDTLIIVADSSDWNAVRDTVQNIIAPVVPTPQPERWYDIRVVPPQQFSNFMYHKNILVLSLLQADTPSNNLLSRMFSPEMVESMRSGEQTLALKRDPWRSQQLLVILTAPSSTRMVEVVEARGKEIKEYFDDAFRKRQKKYLYDRYEQKKMKRQMSELYDWYLRVPRDWVIIKERPDSNFVWIGRHLPIRWISVYWQETRDIKMVDSTVAVELRKTVAQERYKNIYTNPEYLEVEAVDYEGKQGIRIRGIWAHEKESKGGPFTGFAYYDSKTGRLFYIDGTLFAPDMEKLVYLRRLEIVMRTFQSGIAPD